MCVCGEGGAHIAICVVGPVSVMIMIDECTVLFTVYLSLVLSVLIEH